MSIIFIDVDGTLADHEKGFLDWVHNQMRWPDNIPKTISELKEKVGREDFVDLKKAFRLSGAKRDLLPLFTATTLDIIKEIKCLGAKIIVVTSRPFSKFPSLYVDTFIWLAEHGIAFDKLESNENKDLLIAARAIDYKKAWVIEDDPWWRDKIKSILSLMDHQTLLIDDKFSLNDALGYILSNLRGGKHE